MREGEEGRRGGKFFSFFFFFRTHPYKATEVITDVANQLSKQAPLTKVPFYKHGLASPPASPFLRPPSLPRGFALPDVSFLPGPFSSCYFPFSLHWSQGEGACQLRGPLWPRSWC